MRPGVVEAMETWMATMAENFDALQAAALAAAIPPPTYGADDLLRARRAFSFLHEGRRVEWPLRVGTGMWRPIGIEHAWPTTAT